MFDTHCHLNFKSFKKNIGDVIAHAENAGVTHFVVSGTDIKTSERAVELALEYENVYAAVGIHPHHVFEIVSKSLDTRFLTPVGPPRHMSWHPKSFEMGIFAHSNSLSSDTCQTIDSQKFFISSLNPDLVNNVLTELEKLLQNKKVIAVGEIGIDKHYYQKTKYKNYQVNAEFLKLQIQFLKTQIDLAIKYDKSLILHNREAVSDLIKVLIEKWDEKLEGHVVFHCCEPDERLLQFALKHYIYIGVDGDVTYDKVKSEFVKKIPLHLLVLETDSPFLLPRPGGHAEPLRYPNEPKNIPIIAEYIAGIMGKDVEEIKKKTTENAKRLFLI